VQHFGFVVRDLPPVSAYWKGLGFEALKIDQVPARAGSTYQGAQLLLPHYEGSQKYNQYDYFWVAAPDVPANIYADYLNAPRHREGIQHIALSVADLPKEIARYGKLGYRVEQSGMWGQAGHPGSGAFAFMSTEKVGGLSVALFHPD
jgi:catechol 2,3-dioxygenase-like lactoylglutathione lyase family enzyme